MNVEDIKKANESIRTTDIKGKEYAEVNQRIKAFRMVCPEGTIHTEILSLIDGVVTMKAVVEVDGKILGTGHAQEKEAQQGEEAFHTIKSVWSCKDKQIT